MKGTFNDHLSILRSVPELSLASDATLISLVERCEERSLRQGQTLIRPKNFESHGFVVVSGALRLLAQEPFGKDLFSVGRTEVGQLVGVVDLLRQEPCEGAIARQPSLLLSFPLEHLNQLLQNDEGLRAGLQAHWSACEGAAVLTAYLRQLALPPEDSCNWLLLQLQNSNPKSELLNTTESDPTSLL